MECDVCAGPTDTVMMSLNCHHVVCIKCFQKLSSKPCSFCRGPLGKCVQIPVQTYESFVRSKEDGKDRAAAEPFDVLFTSAHRVDYLMTRSMIEMKWSCMTDYTHTDVCSVCLLQHAREDIDITLLNLYYACATITRKTVLDAMTCLHLIYGWRSCKHLSPKDVFFHFFINHCNTKSGFSEEEHYSTTADFVCNILHALIYDIVEIDSIASFINLINTDSQSKCPCNTAQRVLPNVRGNGGNKRTVYIEEMEECDDGPFVPADIMQQSKDFLRWDNAYKWNRADPPPDPVVETEEQKDEQATLMVNCLQIYSDCETCNDMMDHTKYVSIHSLDESVQSNKGFMNTATSVHVECKKRGYSRTQTETLMKHYSDPICELNRKKFINFHSLVKQPSSLTNRVAVTHLYNELFASKRSYMCPFYHLAALCDRIVKSDKSQFKKTKRDSIQRWATKTIGRHAHQGTMCITGSKRSFTGK